MANYTPMVDQAVEVGDLFSKVVEEPVIEESITNTEVWEGATLGINVTAISSLIGALVYFWRRLRATRLDVFGAMDPHMRNDVENPPADCH